MPCRVLAKLSDDSLSRKFAIQGYHVTGLDAVLHVTEHFGYHTGQIIYITKLKGAQDLRFTRLPVIKPAEKKGMAPASRQVILWMPAHKTRA